MVRKATENRKKKTNDKNNTGYQAIEHITTFNKCLLCLDTYLRFFYYILSRYHFQMFQFDA